MIDKSGKPVTINDSTSVSFKPNQSATCVQILELTVNDLRSYLEMVKAVCETRRSRPIEQIIKVFNDLQQFNNDFQYLRSHITDEVQVDIQTVLSYVNDQENIRMISEGLTKLRTKFGVESVPAFLTNILKMNLKTIGEDCIKYYDEFKTQITEKHLPGVLDLISYYGLCYELFEFVETLTEDDVQNLKEETDNRDEDRKSVV